MLIESRFVVQAPPERVWDFLVDPAQMVACVPGCSEVQQTGPTTYRAVMSAKVAYVTFRAPLEIQLTRQDPPHVFESTMRGADARLGSNVDIRTTVSLTPRGDATEVAYRSDVKLGGKLGSLGESLFRGKANQLGRELAERVQREIEARP